jgi:hypothetical protein
MKKYLKLISIAITAFIFYSFIGSAAHTQTTEFFFFELEPVKADLPYYFSQTISISYNDDMDLIRQKKLYFNELKIEVALDKLDTLNYHGYVPPGSDTRDHCENIRTAAQTTLGENGKSVISRNIH